MRIPAGLRVSAPKDFAGGVLVPGPEGSVVWSTSVQVAGGYRLRLHLKSVHLPQEAAIWVQGESESVGPFGLESIDEHGELWTPSVAGESITLQIKLPGERSAEAQLVVAGVLQQFNLDDEGRPILGPHNKDHIEGCLVDGKCATPAILDIIDSYRFAVARLSYIDGGSSFLCTGALLNDTDPTTAVPYLLTANHCISSQSVATTLESFWNYFPSTCNGSWPDLASLPRIVGATLLASGAVGDFTLLRLPSVPAGRVFLGWNASASAVSNGTTLYRLSHPKGYVQSFSAAQYTASPASTCPGWPSSSSLYAHPQMGATFGGSSGSPVILPGGVVVGQLSGVCGPNSSEPCLAGPNDYVVDGRFSTAYPALAPWLSPAPAAGPCNRNSAVACLQSSRFEVNVSWQNGSGSGTGQVMSFGGQRTESDEAAFYYFQSATNFEMGVKILNACIPLFGNKYWVFISGLTDQGWTVTVRDTQTGATKTYNNAVGHLSTTFADTAAFNCN